jgi:hypothetical protein
MLGTAWTSVRAAARVTVRVLVETIGLASGIQGLSGWLEGCTVVGCSNCLAILAIAISLLLQLLTGVESLLGRTVLLLVVLVNE